MENNTIQKPPLGLRPRFIVDNHRAIEILEAALRQLEANKAIPLDWLGELEEINIRLHNNQNKENVKRTFIAKDSLEQFNKASDFS